MNSFAKWTLSALAAGCALAALPAGAKAATLTYAFTRIADTSGGFSGFGASPSINDSGAVAFKANLDAVGASINVGSGGPTTIIADTGGAFFAFGGNTSINDSGAVAFRALLDAGGDSINVGSGGPTTTIADTGGAFSAFGAPSINDSGAVAFRALLDAGGDSINVFSGGMLSAVLSTGDVLDGLVVASLFLGPEGLNDSGALAFFVGFTNGTQAIFRASLVSEVPLPAAAWLMGAGLAGLGFAARRKKKA